MRFDSPPDVHDLAGSRKNGTASSVKLLAPSIRFCARDLRVEKVQMPHQSHAAHQQRVGDRDPRAWRRAGSRETPRWSRLSPVPLIITRSASASCRSGCATDRGSSSTPRTLRTPRPCIDEGHRSPVTGRFHMQVDARHAPGPANTSQWRTASADGEHEADFLAQTGSASIRKSLPRVTVLLERDDRAEEGHPGNSQRDTFFRNDDAGVRRRSAAPRCRNHDSITR